MNLCSRKKIIYSLVISSLLFVPLFSLADFNIGRWAFYKEILLPATLEKVRPVWINLDEEVLKVARVNLGDLRVIEEKTKEMPFKLLTTESQEVAHGSQILNPSSVRAAFRKESFSPSNMIDGDKNTYFQIDYFKDPESASFEIDIKGQILTNKILIWTTDSTNTWTDIKIEASKDCVNWQLVKDKTKVYHSSMRKVVYPESLFQYLRFTFWHTGSLKIHEIEIYAASQAKLLFMAGPVKNYRLYYGNNVSDLPKYDTGALYSDITTPTATLGPGQANPEGRTDYDGDGIANDEDNCPLVYNSDQKDSDSDQVGDVCDNAPLEANRDQKDTDHDGVGDVIDNCPYHKNPDQLDKDLNGIGWVCDDEDNDGIINSLDNCVPHPNYNQSDRDNNGIGDVCEDIDGDGILGYVDNCLYLRNPAQIDTDKDKIGDACDNCLLGWNPDQLDLNNNGVGDICEDDDQDQVPNYLDNCPLVANSAQIDTDGDEFGDICDNCPTMKNPDQKDSNRNGIGDICDDDDGDGVINSRDNCPDFSNPDQKDQNNNGIGDACEDLDNDGVINALDNCIADYNPDQGDKDKDGIGDACDPKDDRWTEKASYLLWITIAIVIGVIVFFAIRLLKKMGQI